MSQKPDPQLNALWSAIRRLSRSYEALARQDKEIAEIGYTEFAILEILARRGNLPVNKIAKLVTLTSGSATTAIDRLERRGFVERNPHTTDRRVRIVGITNTGRNKVRKGFQHHRKAMSDALDVFSKAERATLLALLERASSSVDDML